MDTNLKSISETLRQIAGANTLQKIMDLSFQILGNPMFLTDWNHDLLAYTHGVEINAPFWQRLCSEQRVPDPFGGFSIDDYVRQGNNREKSLKSHAPVPIFEDSDDITGLVKVVEQNGMPLGVLVVSNLLRPFKPEDEDILELISLFVGLKLLQISPEREHHAANQFLLRLLDGEIFSKWQLKELANSMKWLKHNYFCVLTVTHRRETLQRQSNQEIIRLLSSSPHRRAVVYGLEVVCLLSVNAPVLQWKEDPTGTMEIIERAGLIAGASKWFTDMSDFRKNYLMAAKALKMGTVIEYGRTIYTFDEVSVYFQYSLVENETALTDFIHQDIQRLQSYDNKKKGDLISTLYAYLETNQSFSAAAEHLHVHPNTVRYRIGQCIELLKNDLTDGRLCFSYLNSLKIIEYLRQTNASQKSLRP